jgi:hypothetical protein
MLASKSSCPQKCEQRGSSSHAGTISFWCSRWFSLGCFSFFLRAPLELQSSSKWCKTLHHTHVQTTQTSSSTVTFTPGQTCRGHLQRCPPAVTLIPGPQKYYGPLAALACHHENKWWWCEIGEELSLVKESEWQIGIKWNKVVGKRKESECWK